MNIIGMKLQQAMKEQSEREPTVEEKDLAAGVPVEAAPDNTTAVFEEEQVEEIEEVAVELEPTITPDFQLLGEVAESLGAEVVNVTIKPKATVVIGVFQDGMQNFLDANPTLEGSAKTEDGKTLRYNMLQPLGAFNSKSRREGVMYQALPNCLNAIGESKLESVRLVVGSNVVTTAVNEIVSKQIEAACASLYNQFPVFSGEDNGEETAYPYLQTTLDVGAIREGAANNWPVRIERRGTADDVEFTALFNVQDFVTHEVAVTVDVSVSETCKEISLNLHHIIHFRVPILLRVESTRIESTLNAYVANIETAGEQAGVDTEVVLALPSTELLKDATWNMLSLLRENYNAVPVTAQRYFENVGDAMTSGDSYESVLFDNADFLIPLTRKEETVNE